VACPNSLAPVSIPERFLDSTRSDYGARYSPDGRKIAFVSTRSGSPEIWAANPDGSGLTRLTFLQQVSGLNPPAWSPDGRWLLFSGRNQAYLNLLVIPAGGGTPTRLTTSSFDENMATWSRDGRWIYYNSMRSGRRQVWRMPATGGDAAQITTGGGLRPVESSDGKSIFYVAESGGSIWRVPKEGGQETEVVSCVHQTAYGFALTAEGIYYRDCSESKKQYIRFFNPATRQSRPVAEANAPPFGTALSVSPDGKYLLFDQAGNNDMDLILLEDFPLP
jgi:Tol biopolymer transport system component